MPDHLEASLNRANALIALVTRTCPATVHSTLQLDDWNVYAPVSVTRCAYSIESIVRLRDREVDAGILLRSLVDHAITFAWVAADPTPRLRRVIASEFQKRLAANRNMEDLTGVPWLPVARVEHFEQYIQEVGGLAPDARTMASQADQSWLSCFPDLSAQYGFGGIYAVCFRHFSAYVHPTTSGLQAFVTDAVDGGLAIGPPSTDHDCVGLASSVFGLQLHVCSEIMGWPGNDQINQIFETYPNPLARRE